MTAHNYYATPHAVHDVIISGGGLVGASLALALAELKLDVALVEAVPFGRDEQPSFDERTTALTNGSQRIFAALGIWPLIARAATPIKRIHVSEQGRFAFARIDATEQDLPQLGFVVVNRIMGAALWRRLHAASVKTYTARVTAVEATSAGRRAVIDAGGASTVSDSESSVLTLQAKLLVAADGAHSPVRAAAGIGVRVKDYRQIAVVTNVAASKFHEHIAYERFTEDGPIALLPLTDARMGVVWALAAAQAEEVLRLNDEAFLARLQSVFGLRLGRFTQVGKRFSYPLTLTEADQHVGERLVVVGNAAQALHPIAGQGFNLGLRDAACLAEVLADARREGRVDPGSREVLCRYAKWRQDDRRGIIRFTDGLVEWFARRSAPLRTARNLGLLLFDLMPPAKHYLAQLSLGAAGKIPRLARGARLMESDP